MDRWSRALRSPNALERRSAVLLGRTIGRTDTAAVIAALGAALSDPDADVRILAAQALASYGGSARPALRELTALLKDADPDVRLAAAEALPPILRIAPAPSAFVIPPLVASLSDADPAVRAAAAGTLRVWDHRSEAVVPALAKCLSDRNPEVRAAAAAALAAEPDGRTVPALAAALSDPARAVRVAAAGGLAGRPADSAAPALPALRATVRHPDRDTRLAAARALCRLDAADPAAVAMLLTAFPGDGSADAVPLSAEPLVRLLLESGEDDAVRTAAREWYRINSARAELQVRLVGTAVAFLGRPERWLRETGLAMLADADDARISAHPKARETLARVLRDEADPEFRREVAAVAVRSGSAHAALELARSDPRIDVIETALARLAAVVAAEGPDVADAEFALHALMDMACGPDEARSNAADLALAKVRGINGGALAAAAARLRHRDPAVRRRTAELCVRLPAVPDLSLPLAELLADGGPGVAEAAAAALSAHLPTASDAVVSAAVARLGKLPDAELRASLLRALPAEFLEQARPGLEAMLRSPLADLRRFALQRMPPLADDARRRSVLSAVAAARTDRDEDIRLAAVEATHRIALPPENAVDLAGCLADKSVAVRRRTVELLAEMAARDGAETIPPGVAAALKKAAESDEDEIVREHAADALKAVKAVKAAAEGK
jgi:HEAT repeat protein